MHKATILATILSATLVFSGDNGEISLQGNYQADLFSSAFSAGIVPAIHLLKDRRRELLLSIPIRIWGDYFSNGGYKLGMTGVSAGLDAGYYFHFLSYKSITVYTGPEVFLEYGFKPMIYRTIDGQTTKENPTEYFIGRAGLAMPIAIDCSLTRHWGFRCSDRILGLTAQSNYIQGYDSRVKVEAGLETVFSPVFAVVVRF